MTRRLLLLTLVILGASAAGSQEPVFRTEARTVEVYATVLDRHGRYVDGLPRESFQVAENGRAQPIASFDSDSTELSCAILLDTTGSMQKALPALKNVISRLIDEFRDRDFISIYAFSTAFEQLQDFTRDKSAAKRAVMRTRAEGETALFDALMRVAIAAAGRPGKKAVLVFTDGDDNASVISAQRASEQARKLGVPVYTVAQGEAGRSNVLMRTLKEIARTTGGNAYTVKQAHDSAKIFEDVAAELQHTYLLSYRFPEGKEDGWRKIQVSLSGAKEYKDYTIRAKEGYYPN